MTAHIRTLVHHLGLKQAAAMDERLQSIWFRLSAVSLLAVSGLFSAAAAGQESPSPDVVGSTDILNDPSTAQNDITFQSEALAPPSTTTPELEVGRDDQTDQPFMGEYPPGIGPIRKLTNVQYPAVWIAAASCSMAIIPRASSTAL